MSGTFTKAQVDRLGERLRNQATPDSASLGMLQEVRAAYDGPLTKVETILREELNLNATSRLKTVNTIVDKLKRERTRLSKMQDIAGLRIVEDVTLSEQDALVQRLRSALPESRLVDRRLRPSYGYRAVHVIATVDEIPIEIQVRSVLQDLWAQTVERVADVAGRGIRYGDPPEALLGTVHTLLNSSEQIADVEASLDELQRNADSTAIPGPEAGSRSLARLVGTKNRLRVTFEEILLAVTKVAP